MAKWEETVMGERQLKEVSGIEDTTLAYLVALPILQKQAEIAWEARDKLAKEEVAEAEQRGIRKVVDADKELTMHVLQDGYGGDWSIESWRLKEWFRKRQAFLKSIGVNSKEK